MEERIVDRAAASRLLPRRSPETHKGDYGSVLCVCGSVGYTGAALMSSRACVRGGAGLVYIAVPDRIYGIVAGSSLEAMPFPVPSSPSGGFSPDAAGEIAERLERCGVALAGCGVISDGGADAALDALLTRGKRVILDAGMFAPLVRRGITNRPDSIELILTPHDGELRRLCGGDPFRPGETRVETARRLAAEWKVTLVMKGHVTLTASPDGRVSVNTTGNAGMARGGSGDVLAGLIAAMWAQLPDAADAASLAVYLHGRAGDVAASRYSVHGMTPGDMLDTVRDAFLEIE